MTNPFERPMAGHVMQRNWPLTKLRRSCTTGGKPFSRRKLMFEPASDVLVVLKAEVLSTYLEGVLSAVAN